MLLFEVCLQSRLRCPRVVIPRSLLLAQIRQMLIQHLLVRVVVLVHSILLLLRPFFLDRDSMH
jgi:hypothetical protein